MATLNAPDISPGLVPPLDQGRLRVPPSADSGTAGSALPRLPALDGLRGTAILLVILFHCLLSTRNSHTRTLDSWFENLVNTFAPLAMDLFFVISGYLITSILDRTRDADNPLKTFYMRRVLRIVPLYYGFLIFTVVFLRGLPEVIIGPPGSIKWEFLFLTNFTFGLHGHAGVGALFPHFWTLAIEEQFYVFWPLLILFQRESRNVITCLLLVAISLAARSILLFGHIEMWLPSVFSSWERVTDSAFLITPCRMDGLAIGAAVAFLHRRRPDILENWSVRLMILPVSIVVVLSVSFALLKVNADVLFRVIIPLLSSVFFGALVARLAINPGKNTPGWTLHPLLRSVARYSYGMYAFHVPVITLLFHMKFIRDKADVSGYALPYRMYFFTVIAGISYCLGYISWHYYEKKFLRLAPAYSYTRRALARL